jgi:PAS domain S-box-containing protein/putative nucleotidyltransferase with HDIG domain
VVPDAASPPQASKLQVLCLEDSPEDAQLICELLRDAGLDMAADVVDERAGFEEALSAHTYDVILADYKLPGFDAPAALRIATRLCAETPFIVVSGSIGEETAVELLKQGAADYVLKDRLGRLPFAIERALQAAQERGARQKAEAALRDSEERYRSYVESAPYGVFVSDEQGRYLEVNNAAAEITGYSRKELARMSIADVVAPESLEWSRQQFARLVDCGRSSGNGLFLRKDGMKVNGRVDSVRLSATRYLGFLVDVSEQERGKAELKAGAVQLKRTLKAAVASLGATTELRDPYTAGHQRRVAELAGAIAVELGWDEGRIETLNTSALLHDVGKIVVPAEILAKPGRLTDTEMMLIRLHAAVGADVVADIDFQGAVAETIRQHHERLDGSGYPAGLRGEAILPEARVLAVADVVEAMISHRPYRPALPVEEALTEVERGAGVLYDAEAAAACVRLLREKGFTLGD